MQNKRKKAIILGIIVVIIAFYIYPNYLRPIEGNPLVDKNSPYYVNSLYMSEGKIYNTLSNNEKIAYDYLLSHSLKHKWYNETTLTELNCASASECSKNFSVAHDALLFDHPELLNYSTCGWQISGENVIITIDSAIKLKISDFLGEKKIARIIDNIKKDTQNMSDKEKIIYVYDYIGENAEYDYTFTHSSKNQSSYNVLIKHNAVCAGFAKTAQIIFQNIGIESYIAFGNNHMWNVVKYNDKYYYFDSTVAACRDKDSDGYYDGLKQTYLSKNTLENIDWYPKIETTNMFEIN